MIHAVFLGFVIGILIVPGSYAVTWWLTGRCLGQ